MAKTEKMSLYSQVIHQTRYARWNEEDQRREFWGETVDRFVSHFDKHLAEKHGFKIPAKVAKEVRDGIFELDIMPSMRTLMTAGKALESCSVSNYNCSYTVVDNIRAFSEHMYVLMSGSGSGFSVERRFTDKLPEIPAELHPTDTTVVVSDSRKGWCVALNQFLNLLYAGNIPQWDVSKVRPEGARLKTFGGYSSGPGVLVELFQHIISTFKAARGRKLRSIEVFSIMCYVAQIVVVGGVRRCKNVDDLIWTSEGLKKIGDVTVGSYVVSVNGELKEITGKEYTGVKPLVRVRTRAGEFDVTPEHRVAVYNRFSFEDKEPDIRWIEAGKLTTEDSLVWYNGTLDVAGSNLISHTTPSADVLGFHATEDTSSHRGDSAQIDINALNLVEWAWLVGYLHGDGCVHVNRDNTRTAVSFALAADMPETRTKIENLLKRIGVNYQTKAHGPKSTWYTIRIRSSQLGLFLSQWKSGKVHFEVPEFVLQGDEQIRLAYLAGALDADGSCKAGAKRQGSRGIVVVSTTTRERHYAALKALLSSIGATYGTGLYRPSRDKMTIRLTTTSIKNQIAKKLAQYSEKVRNDFEVSTNPHDSNGLGIPVELMSTEEWQELTGRRGKSASGNLSLPSLGKSDFVGHLPARVLEVQTLQPVETVDISVDDTECFIDNGHLVHNSATIALFDKDDAEMRAAKSGQWWVNNAHFAMANISAVFESKPRAMEFMDIWRDLVASGSGEPGVLNRKALWEDAERIGRETRDHTGARYSLGVNPSLAAGTRVLTTDGIFPIEQLEGKKDLHVPNLHGEISPAVCFLSGKDKPLYEVKLRGGRSFFATAEHKWPVYEAAHQRIRKYTTLQLRKGDKLPISMNDSLPEGTLGDEEDGFIIGWNLADGWITNREHGEQIGFIVEKDDRASDIHTRIATYLRERCGWTGSFDDKTEINVNNPSLRDVFAKFGVEHKSQGLPASVWNATTEAFRRGLISALFSADGCVDKRGIQYGTAHEKLANDVADLLGFYGIPCTITRRDKDSATFPNGKTYDRSYTYFEVRCRHLGAVARFAQLFKLARTDKQDRLNKLYEKGRGKRYFVAVDSVTLTNRVEDVWDLTVHDETHSFHLAGVVTGNCSEISLRPNQFCNLSGVAIRPTDTLNDLKNKIKLATIIGTWQATISDFDYLRKNWKDNVEEERLLGVCLAGIMDHPVLSTQTKESEEWLQELKAQAWAVNKEWAKKLGINSTASVTAIKPAGNSGELYSVSSGIHPRYAPYYIRTIRQSNGDPMTQFLMDSGIPWEPSKQNPRDVVFSFPVKSPEGATCAPDLTAMQQLEHWLHFKRNYATHTISCTIYVRDSEWPTVGAWVYEHFDEITGLSFLPYDDHTYEQAPYQPITEEQYNKIVAEFPDKIDWTLLKHYEGGKDTTTVSQEFTCVGGACELK
jgi:intein/homing endonuclease